MAFPTGMLYAEYEDKVANICSKHYWLPIFIVMILLTIQRLTGKYTLVFGELPYVFKGPLVAILLSRMPLPTENKLLNFLGTLSFEIYLTHGTFEQLLKNAFASPYLYIVVVVALTILTSWLLHNVYSKITSPLLAKVK